MKSNAWRSLLAACGELRFEPHDIASQLDGRGRYAVELDDEFPLLIKLFRYTSKRHTRGATWHDRLELFLPLDPVLTKACQRQPWVLWSVYCLVYLKQCVLMPKNRAN